MYKNKVELTGKIWKPIYEASKAGNFYWRATLSQSFKKEDGSYNNQYFNIVAFNEIAEVANKLVNDDVCLINGYLSQSTYEKDGIKQYSISIIANSFTKLESASKQSTTKNQSQEKTEDIKDNNYNNFGDDSYNDFDDDII